MSLYRMEDGTVVNTDKARQSWAEVQDHDGSNRYGRSSRSQCASETLYESRKGRFYIERESNYNGHHAGAEWISEQAAVRWLVLNEKDVPERLAHLVEEVTE